MYQEKMFMAKAFYPSMENDWRNKHTFFDNLFRKARNHRESGNFLDYLFYINMIVKYDLISVYECNKKSTE